MKYKESSWNLSAVTPKDINSTLKEIELKVKSLENLRPKLTDSLSIDEFLKILKEFERLRILTSKIGCFSFLKFTENSADQKAVARMSHIENFLTKAGNRLIFFSLWFKNLNAKKARQLINASGKYKYHLEQIRKDKPYTLKEKEEQIINIKDTTGVSALNNVYNILTSQFKFKLKGKELTLEELISKVRDPSPEIRKAAYLEILTKYKKHKDVIGEIYKSIINDWREENVFLRGHKNPLSVRSSSQDIPEKAVESLLQVCEKNQHLFHRFFEIKRKRLGLKNLRRFDIYAPIKTKKEKKIPYDKAIKMVLDCYQSFSPKFKQEALKIIDNEHIHSKLQKNKRGGAFCCGVATETVPFILVNYTAHLRDISTIAHELGHGVHYLLSSCQTEFTHEACLPLAETASIFGEMLLSEKIIQDEPNKAKDILFFKLDDLYASIIRQAGFVMFEKKAHQMMKEGKTIEEMSQVYLIDLKKQLGNKVNVEPIFAYEWAFIPHIFHTPFYCYAYAFGNLLVLALWEMYKEKGQPFAEKIIEMLSKGSSESPIAITKAVGIDICSEEFWQKGFAVIEKMINEVES